MERFQSFPPLPPWFLKSFLLLMVFFSFSFYTCVILTHLICEDGKPSQWFYSMIRFSLIYHHYYISWLLVLSNSSLHMCFNHFYSITLCKEIPSALGFLPLGFIILACNRSAFDLLPQIRNHILLISESLTEATVPYTACAQKMLAGIKYKSVKMFWNIFFLFSYENIQHTETSEHSCIPHE